MPSKIMCLNVTQSASVFSVLSPDVLRVSCRFVLVKKISMPSKKLFIAKESHIQITDITEGANLATVPIGQQVNFLFLKLMCWKLEILII